MSEVAVGRGPLVPDAHTMVLEVAHVGVAVEKPQQLVDDGFEMQFLGGEQGEALFEVESHLIAEHRAGAGAGAVGFLHPVVHDVAEQIEILFHVIM